MHDKALDTTCCIVGGGPAGMMLGYLLARAGINVTVLEKHKDFFRDFRGDTVHPSTLQVIYELGFLDDFLKVPHQQLERIGGVFGDFLFEAADFRHLPTRCKFIALMPQWDFLNFFAEKAQRYPTFSLRMEHEAVGLIEDDGQVTGVKVKTPEGALDIHSHLVVGCDGRHAVTRSAARFEVREFGVPIDVLWFHIARKPTDPERLLGNVNYGSALVLINRESYFQAGLLIRKGSFEQVKRDGLDAFHKRIVRIAPYLADRVAQINTWDQVKLLSVQINRLKQWHRPGLLCIGDAAHAMSPAGGVGINLAIQDAVATANLLIDPLLRHEVTDAQLARVQCRREFPTRVTQAIQAFIHNRFDVVFQNTGPAKASWQLKAIVRIPGIQRLTGRAVGMGVRPEHVADQSQKKLTPKRIAIAAGLIAASTVIAIRCLGRHHSPLRPSTRLGI